MAGTYSKTIIYTGDANPNGDNYQWIDVNGAISQGWITLNPQMQDSDSWDFTIQTWSNPGSASSRSAEFKVRHWLWTNDSQSTYWDSFLITQYADGTVTTTTTEPTTTTTEATTTTTEATTTTTAATTTTTAAPQYTTTWTAGYFGGNATIHTSDSTTSSVDNTDTRIATAGTVVTRSFYLRPTSNYEWTSTNQVTVQYSQGSAVVDSITSNGNMKINVSHTTNTTDNSITLSIGGDGPSSTIPNTIVFDDSPFIVNDEVTIVPAGGQYSYPFTVTPSISSTMVVNASQEDGFGANKITFVTDASGTTQTDKPSWITGVSGSISNGSGSLGFTCANNVSGTE